MWPKNAFHTGDATPLRKDFHASLSRAICSKIGIASLFNCLSFVALGSTYVHRALRVFEVKRPTPTPRLTTVSGLRASNKGATVIPARDQVRSRIVHGGYECAQINSSAGHLLAPRLCSSVVQFASDGENVVPSFFNGSE